MCTQQVDASGHRTLGTAEVRREILVLAGRQRQVLLWPTGGLAMQDGAQGERKRKRERERKEREREKRERGNKRGTERNRESEEISKR